MFIESGASDDALRQEGMFIESGASDDAHRQEGHVYRKRCERRRPPSGGPCL
jgi:hypothetical protein